MLDDIHEQPSLVQEIPPQNERRAVLDWLAQRLSQSAGLPRTAVDAGRPFIEYGISSIKLIGIVSDLSRACGHPLPPTLGFDNPTPQRLAEAVCRMGRPDSPSRPAVSAAVPASSASAAFIPSPGAALEQVAVIGMWCRFPGGCNSPEAFWELLRSGRDAVGKIPADRFDADALLCRGDMQPGGIASNQGGFIDDVDLFDADFFGISPREAALVDPQQRLLLEVGWHALEHAGINPDNLKRTKTGVFIGASGSDYGRMVFTRPEQLTLASATGSSPSILANRLSYFLGAQGPSLAIDTACSSSLVAVHAACRSLQTGDADLALAGGVNLILSPEMTIVFSQAGLMAPDGRCKTFDKSANGYVRSEGCGLVVLKRLADARRDGDRIWGVILSCAVNQDGQSNGLTVPNGQAQKALLAEALEQAGIAPGQMDYLEAHGTGTPVGDPIEIAAAGAVLGGERDRPLLIGSVKTNLGHLEQAAGVAGLIKVLLALRHGVTPPNLHFVEANPLIDLQAASACVPTLPTPWPPHQDRPRTAGISGFSFGGTNAHIIVAEPPARPKPGQPQAGNHTLCLGARSQDALHRLALDYTAWLARPDVPPLDAVCREANTGRARYAHRLAVTGNSPAALVSRLEAFAEGRAGPGIHTGHGLGQPRTAFLFTGQGAQHFGMGRELHETCPLARELLEHCQDQLRHALDRPLLEVMFHNPEAASLLDDTAYTQPALFALEYALARQLEAWGLRPDLVMGHSIGEYTAACLAGVFSLEDALRLVAARGRLIQSLPAGGGMAAVFAGMDTVAPLLARQPGLSVAAVNGPESLVLSGPEAMLQPALADLDAQGVGHVRLTVSHAFHSSLMEPILDKFEAVAHTVSFGVPRLPVVSNVTGELAPGRLLSAPDYWRRHLRQPVRFMEGMRALEQDEATFFVEIGPHPVLTGLGAGCLETPQGHAFAAPLRRGTALDASLSEALAAIHAAGGAIDWRAYYRGLALGPLPLPVYPFTRTRHWIDREDYQPALSRQAAPAALPEPASPRQAPADAAINIRAKLRAAASPRDRMRLLADRVAALAADILLLPARTAAAFDRPLIRMGLDSLMAVQLKAGVDAALGINAPLGAFLADQSLDELAGALDALAALAGDAPPSEDQGHAPVIHDAADRHKPFALTDVQHAYWTGRQPDMELGGVGCQVYAEVDVDGLDASRLEAAIDTLVARHDMLRAVVDADGRQRVLPDPGPYRIPVEDLAGLPEVRRSEKLRAIRDALSRQCPDTATWPLFTVRASGLGAGKTRLHVVFDMLIGDGMSFLILLEELEALYADPRAELLPVGITFRDCVLAQSAPVQVQAQQEALAYWRARLDSLPPGPRLTTRPAAAVAARPRFDRLRGLLPKAAWAKFRERAAGHGLTPSTALLAAFAEVLAAWSASPHFSLNLTLFNRPPVHPDIGRVVGDFTTLLLLETHVGDRPFADNAVLAQQQLWRDMEHRQACAVDVLREMRRARRDDAPETMPVVFTSLLPLSGTRGRAGFAPTLPQARVHYCLSSTPQVWLDHQVYEEDGALRYNWDFVQGLFPDGMLEAMFEAYQGLLTRLADADDTWSAPVGDLAPAAHRQRVLAINAKTRDLPPVTLHGLFTRSARAVPERTAVLAGQTSLSYGQLDELARNVASGLVAAGVAPGDIVAVVLPKGWEQVVAVLGILMAAAAYLPIETDTPPARLAALLAAARTSAAVTLPETAASADWPGEIRAYSVQDLASRAVEGALPETAPAQPAYVIFTSGSTGTPKGVVQDHKSVVNTVLDINQRLALGPSDAIFGVSNLNFDLSAYDIFGALAAGATLVLPDAGLTREPRHWIKRLRAAGVTVWNSAPALMQMLLTALDGTDLPAPGRLRQIMLSGDWIGADLARDIRARFPDARLLALGGATEAAIWSICHPVETVGETDVNIPYGTPLTNQKLLVLDERLRLCPPHAVGHLHIGGAGLALGYLGDPGRTAQAFIRHPATGERLYRTGDLGRYRSDGVIEFVGRSDFQVKIRGHRIELGEIEHALKQHPDVRETVVTVSGEPGKSRRLTAFVTGGDGTELAGYLRSRLPAFMVPASFVAVDAFPLTPSGKIDRKALAAPQEPAADATAPANEKEAALLAVWSEVLGRADLGVTDDFFEAGGDSLLATRIVAAARKTLGAELSLNALFTAPTVRELAKALPESEAGEDRDNTLTALEPDPAGRFEPFPLTDIQHAYWMGRDSAYELGNVSAHFYYEIENAGLDVDRLEQAWQRVVARHDMLRAVVLPDGRQQVLAAAPPYAFAREDLREHAPEAIRERLAKRRETMANQQLDPGTWPLFDIRVSLLPEGRVRLHIDIDNLIADAWSLFTFLKEWAAFANDPDFISPPPALGFRDYVMAHKALRHTPAYERDRAYWLDRLADLPPAPELPLARAPSSIARPRFARASRRLPADPWKRLSARAAAAGLTPSAVLITAYAEVLAAWSASPRFTINITLFNRFPLHPDVDAVVGDFTSLNLLEVDRSQDATLPEKARRDQAQLWRDMDHRLFGGVSVMREIALARNASRMAVMPVVFTSALMGSVGHDAAVLASFGELAYSIFQTPQVWLDHQVYEDRGELVLNWDYVDGLFPPGLPEDMFAAYNALLDAMAAKDDWSDLGVRLPKEQARRIRELNDTGEAGPAATLHGLFAAQAASRPNAPAVVWGEGSLSRAALAESASRIAAALAARGVVPGRPVAVVLGRGPEQIEAVAGVLMAGAAYLPLVPPLPPRRLEAILKDAGVELVLTDTALARSLAWPDGVTALAVEDARQAPSANLPEVSPQSLAYVIYTSGSTGTPKGVAVTHASAANTLTDINARFGVGPDDRVLAVSSLGFDLSVYDIFGALAAGAAVVIPDGRRNDPAIWLEAMQRHDVTLWNSAPALLDMLVTHVSGTSRRIPESLRLVLASGDRIPPDLPGRVAALAPKARMVSLGGATEAAVWSVLYPIDAPLPGFGGIPYGRPMRGQRLYVLDHALRHRPQWTPGDLYIAGAGLALGYWNDPEKTRASFITHPATGERLYRTGDLARYRPEGELEFLGRADQQLKIRGHRVEPGEIEAALRAFAGVDAALVVATGTTATERSLVAYLAMSRPKELDPHRLRAHLEERLPGHMIPAAFMPLEAFPVTANGKIDRSRLPDPPTRPVPARPETPGGLEPAASAFMGIIADILGIGEVEADANFFELGLTSFHLVQVQARMRETNNTDIPVADFFLHPTPRLLAAALAVGDSPADQGDGDSAGLA